MIGEHTSVALTVTPVPTAQAFAPITFNATVTSTAAGVPAGSATFYSDIAATQPINAAIVQNGVATLIAGLPGGTYSITAHYMGDETFNVATSNSVPEKVLPDSTSLSLTSAINPGLARQRIPIKATLATSVSIVAGGIAHNIIDFFSNGVSIGSQTTGADGVATLNYAFPAGNYTLTAKFAGNASFNASESTFVIEVVKEDVNTSTTTTLAVTPNPGFPGQSETLTATVAPVSPSTPAGLVLTGNVNFFDASTMVGSSPVDAKGQATFSTSTFTVGSHSLTAVYSGDTTFQTSSSPPVILNIILSDFTLTADPRITIQSQHHGPLNVTLAAFGSFADTITLACSNLPASASCNFIGGGTQGLFSLANGAIATTSINIDTDALLNFASLSPPQSSAKIWKGIAVALLFPLTLLAGRRRRHHLRLIEALFALTFVATLTGCSGHIPGHTPPGTYTITLTAKGAQTGMMQTQNVILIVTE